MRVALTGASGFTGRFVNAALIAKGVECKALDADLCDAEAVETAVRATEFDCLIHLAARAFVNSDDWNSFYTVNQLGTLHLLGAVARVRPGARCIVASSAQVYGPGAEGLIAEDAPTSPANHYAISKLAMEMGAALWRDRLEVVVTRPFNYSGIHQEADYLIPKIVDHFRRKATVIELGNLWVQRDFGDVRDVADVYVSLALAAKVPPVINIATGTVHSIQQIIDALEIISGHSLRVVVNPAFVRPNDVKVLGGDVTRLKRCMETWNPRELEQTLAWMYKGQNSP